MGLKHYWNLLRGKTDATRPASFLNLKNIFAVFQATTRKIGGFALAPHIYEQIIWRRYEVEKKSPACWNEGYCKVCGCDIYGKTMEDRACSLIEHPDLSENLKPCYPAMMDKATWEVYKKDNNIKYFQ